MCKVERTQREWIRRLRFARVHRPYTLVLVLIMPIPGGLALIYGDDVSAALEAVNAGVISRAMGALLMVGSVVTLVGIGRGRSYMEAVGLLVLSAGLLIYGVGVILGLGLAGTVASSGFVALALGSILRVVSLTAAAHELKALGHDK